MSLLEEWEAGTVYQEQTRTDDGALPGVGTEVIAQPAASGLSIFGIQIVERQIARFESGFIDIASTSVTHAVSQAGPSTLQHVHNCRGKGQVAAVAAAEGCATLVTNRAYVIRYDLQQGGTPGAILVAAALPATSSHAAYSSQVCVLMHSAGAGTHKAQ